MPKPSRFSRRARLDQLFKAHPTQVEEWQSEWCKYLCIRLYGYLERTFVEIVEAYVSKCAAPNVASYVAVRLTGLNSATPDNCIKVASDFQPDWGEQLSVFVSAGEIKAHVASVTANRHQIAHGNDVGLTLSRLQSYKESVEAFLDESQRIFS